MSGRSAERIAIVQATRQGSGFLLNSRLILTSAHLFDGVDTARVAVPGGTGIQNCRLLWHRLDEACDAALLEASEDLVAGASRYQISDIKWGKITGLAARNGCEAIGYPRISLRDGARPDTEQIVGTLKPGSSILRGRYILDSSHSAPPESGDATQSPWQGMSGAALFANDYLIGVVSGDPTQWRHARVEAVPISVLVEDSEFRRAIHGVTGLRPELSEVTKQTSYSSPNTVDAVAFRWHLISQADPISFGIHRVPDYPGYSQVVDYVPRTVDTELDERLEDLTETGGMLLLTGDSAAGKSRALFESMLRKLSGWLVCKPDPDANISFLLATARDEKRVIWLDDLDSYLHSDSLTPSLLDELTARKMIVLSTLRTEFYEHYTDESGAQSISRATGPRIPSAPGRVIRMAHHIALQRIWTDVERQSASLSEDPRVSEALKSDKAYGLAEYLAAGPQVLKLWRSASRVKGNPRGAALVAAAIDLARTGVDPSLPRGAVERLHEHYLDQAGGPALRPESIDEAWAWASKVILGVTSPLVPGRGGTWKPFDYLVSDIARMSHPTDLPEQVWPEALRVVDDSRRALVSTVARVAGRRDIAKEVLRPLADADDPDGLINLGALSASEHDYESANRYFMRASDIGDATGTHNLGALCYTRGDLEGARKWYALAIERGELQSIGALGLVCEKLGNQDEAVALWKRGTEAGDPGSALHYSDWLASKWQSDEAMGALRVAADGENPFAALSYAGALLRKKDHETANVYVSRSYEIATKQGYLGDPVGCLIAGVNAYSFGNVQMGKTWWDRARDNGCQIDWVVLNAPDDAPGLRHLVIDQVTLDKLGDDEAYLLMQILWSGDCLDCGYPLKEGVPALYVDDHYNWADAKLFHFGLCRYPRWNDSALTTVAKDAGISWESFTTGVPAGYNLDQLIPALIVNPSMEAAHLVSDGQGWRATGVYGPRSTLSAALHLRPIWAGLPPKTSDGLAWSLTDSDEVAVAALHQVWSAPAAEELTALVEQYGGVLLIVTSAFGPGTPVTMEVVMDVLESWTSMTRWAPLGTNAAL